jgi:hypothetical protein
MGRYMWAAVVGSILVLPGSAAAASYNCLPIELLEVGDRFHVQCACSGNEGGCPRDGTNAISYFAVSKADIDFAKRFVHMMQTAITAGLVVQFQYTSGDISGATFGCDASNCRKPWAFGLLAPATAVRVP